jgi:hypothetical protein
MDLSDSMMRDRESAEAGTGGQWKTEGCDAMVAIEA